MSIIEQQLRRGINARISNDELKKLKFKPKQEKKLKSHKKDYPVIKTVLLSGRKMIVTQEEKVIDDLHAFPGVSCICGKDIDEVEYTA
jgi:hypothetical protein